MHRSDRVFGDTLAARYCPARPPHRHGVINLGRPDTSAADIDARFMLYM